METILNALKLNDVLHNPAELIRLGLSFKKNMFMMKARSSEVRFAEDFGV
jgi:hypothetical protein